MSSALDVAKYIVDKVSADGKSISNLRLQYLLYLTQKNALKMYGRTVFSDQIEAHRFGPRVKIVFQYFDRYGIKGTSAYNPIVVDDRRIIDNVLLYANDRSLSDLYELCKDKAVNHASLGEVMPTYKIHYA